jgi:DNA-binding SARP family transcriptional activator
MPSLRLFGVASLEGDAGAVSGPAIQQHRVALLALLATAPACSLPRTKLAAYLWPERTEDRARKLLNQAVRVLRGVLGADAVRSEGQALRLDAAVLPSDVIAFRAALVAGDPRTAVALYQGPFLDGFLLPDATEFEHWAAGERERLGSEYAGALETLAEAAAREGDVLGAVSWWKARATHDPYDSRVAIRLMEALAAAGNPAGAVRHAEAHATLLMTELSIAPTADLVALANQLESRRHLRPCDLRPPPLRQGGGRG